MFAPPLAGDVTLARRQFELSLRLDTLLGMTRSPTTTKKASRSTTPTGTLAKSRSLAANAQRAHAASVAKHRARAEAAVVRIRDLRARIEEDFLEIGRELTTLEDPKMIAALGYDDFAQLCETALEMTLPKARRLIAITTRITVELARTLTQDRAAALLALVDATPDEDTAEDVFTAKLKLPDGTKLVVAHATAKELWDAARAIRRHEAAKRGVRPRGRTIAPEEQATATALTKLVRKDRALRGTDLTLKASPKGGGARLHLAVDLALLPRLAALLASLGG